MIIKKTIFELNHKAWKGISHVQGHEWSHEEELEDMERLGVRGKGGYSQMSERSSPT